MALTIRRVHPANWPSGFWPIVRHSVASNDSKQVTHHDYHMKKGGNENHINEPMLFEDMLTGPEMDYIFSDGEFYW